jgi:hypothetical protein
MTDAQLQGIGAQALNMAKRDIEQGSFNFLLASYHECDETKLHRMPDVEALIIERLGKDWLNDGRAKDIGFRLLRMAVDLMPPDAVVFVTLCNSFGPTAKFHELTPAQQTELIEAGHNRHHQAVKEGLMDRYDILLATVQTPERVCMYRQVLDERGEFSGKPETRCGPQKGFGGRLKMFGKGKYAFSE